MKAAFFHDTPLVSNKKGQVYSVGFTYNIWERYLTVFDFLVVSTRISNQKVSNGKMKLSSGPKVEFKPIDKYRKKTDMLLNKKEMVTQVRETIDKVDYVIIRLPSVIGQIAAKEAKLMNKPYLIEVVGCAWDSLWNHSLKGKLLAPYMYINTKKIVKNAKHVVYVTNNFLQNRYPTSGKYINCSNVALTEFDDEVLERRINKIRSRNNSKVIIGTVAAVNIRYKGQQYVIEALGKLKKHGNTNFEYQLIGGGDQSYLKSIAKKYDVMNQVKFHGIKPHNEVIEWLDSIDIYIQPSLTEGLPRALIEAMSRGLPSIGSYAGGIPELLEDEYIVRNIRKNIESISIILKSLDGENMQIQAKRNFDESKKYDKEKIETRRKQFLIDFRE